MRRELNRLIARGVSECGCEDDFARAIARFEGWTGPIRNHRRRVWQALAENTDRKFDGEWAAIALGVFVAYDRADLADAVIGYYQRRRWEAELKQEEQEHLDRPGMLSVRSEARPRRAG